MVIIGFCNLKGGVGKTTACVNIAAALAAYGKKIAVVDMDPQSNLSAGFGVNPSPEDPQVFDLLSGAVTWDDIVVQKEGIDIIPSSLNLAMAEINSSSPVNSHKILREVLRNVDPERYDYIFLDSPPQLGIFTRNVLAAADKIIVPMDGGFYSFFGLELLYESLGALSERLGNKIEIMGILMTNYNPRLIVSKHIFDEVKNKFGDMVFENCVPQNVAIIEASSVGESIFQYEPKSKSAECYMKITDEFLAKIGDSRDSDIVPSFRQPKRVKRNSKPQTQTGEPKIQTVTEEPKIEPVPEPEPLIISEPEIITEEITPPTPVPEPEAAPEPVVIPNERANEKAPALVSVSGSYEEGIKQDILEMLPDNRRNFWSQMLAPISDITRSQIDIYTLRDDFEESDRSRFTFYILNDETDTFWPVMYPDQISEPLKCVIKWDEHGAVEVFM